MPVCSLFVPAKTRQRLSQVRGRSASGWGREPTFKNSERTTAEPQEGEIGPLPFERSAIFPEVHVACPCTPHNKLWGLQNCLDLLGVQLPLGQQSHCQALHGIHINLISEIAGPGHK